MVPSLLAEYTVAQSTSKLVTAPVCPWKLPVGRWGGGVVRERGHLSIEGGVHLSIEGGGVYL
jgi:hypothetical protein